MIGFAQENDEPVSDRPDVGTSVTELEIAPLGLEATLRFPRDARGIVLFAHGSGSSRHSVRNVYVAKLFAQAGFATLLFDLLARDEENDRRNVFDIPLLAERLVAAVQWADRFERTKDLPIGLFGASTGAAAALVAADLLGNKISAIVSRGGRPDLAAAALETVQVPTLLIVGGQDIDVLKLNRAAYAQLTGPKGLTVIPGATHLFEEEGALDAVFTAALAWFERHLFRNSEHLFGLE